MCLHWCRLLGGFSDSQSWAQQSEIKKQNQKKLGRRQSKSRVLREAAETRGVGGSSVKAPADGGMGCSAPAPEDPASPPKSRPSAGRLREQHSAAHWRPEALTPTLPLTPQVHLPRRCAPENQHQDPSRDHAQTIRCHQAVGPQRLQRFSSAWKVGSVFLCTLCFIFMYFL